MGKPLYEKLGFKETQVLQEYHLEKLTPDIPTIKIRDATLSDLAAIRELCRVSKAYWGYDDSFINKFMDQYGITIESLQQNIFKLFFESEKLIGFYSFAINEGEAISLSLEDFFIHPDYIGKGIGKMMWLHCINFAKSIDKTEFILEADPNAIGFYEKMGCIQVGTRDSLVMKDRRIPLLVYTLRL